MKEEGEKSRMRYSSSSSVAPQTLRKSFNIKGEACNKHCVQAKFKPIKSLAGLAMRN